MKAILKNGAGLLAAASLALTPMAASAQARDYDKGIYDLLLDCATMQSLFAQAAENEADKNRATSSAVGFISAAESLSGAEITDYAKVLDPRRERLLGQLRKKDPALTRMVLTCAAIERVGRDAIAAEKLD